MKKKLLAFFAFIILVFPMTVLAEEGYCPLGPDVTKDLYGLLKIFNIVAPILCISLSVYEVVKTITKGDASTDMKKIATRFGKRVIYTVLLIFLPLLVDQVMQIADVWGANGTCELSSSSENGSNGNTYIETTCYVCTTSDTYYKITSQSVYDDIVNNGKCPGWALKPVEDESKC